MYILFNFKLMVAIYIIIAIPVAIMNQYIKSDGMGLGHYLLAIFIIAPLSTCLLIIIGTISMLFLNWLMPGLFG